MADLIAKKKDGLELTKEELNFIIQGYVQGRIPDYQISALAMAICFQGMTAEETADLTMAMVNSGEQVEITIPGKIVVDKHSSGGVGDKTTLIVGPLVAACGVPVAKMSGRGLGHTGGTIDKLQSIPGLNVEMSEQAFRAQVKEIGLAIVAQSDSLVPADKKLYSLRDVTATVDSIPLIASSIMSKKIASGAQAIVLDVKYGSGAFMATEQQARELAQAMVDIGKNVGRDTVAIISDMGQPLGRAVGNSLEVLEAMECLQGKGPQDLMEVCLELASWMLVLGKITDTTQRARVILEDVLKQGKAWDKFLEFVSAQGGDIVKLKNKELPLSPLKIQFQAPAQGYIQNIDARKVGTSAMILGAGRENKESTIDYGAGIYFLKKTGQQVEKGEPLMELYTSDVQKVQPALNLLSQALTISDSYEPEEPKVSAVVC
ncbi:MAG: pyrimidine-nucleoside phosphorylase [Peptococcaceae bacterium]|nr:pyrimidine-nucleoside phosphorylase [Peptococcaceae bacterium]